MEARECLIRLSYEGIHDLLNLHDYIKIEKIFITDDDNMSNRITIQLNTGYHIRPEGLTMTIIPLTDLQKEKK